MKWNWGVAKDILSHVAEGKSDDIRNNDEVDYHIRILLDRKYVDGSEIRNIVGRNSFFLNGLTPEGDSLLKELEDNPDTQNPQYGFRI